MRIKIFNWIIKLFIMKEKDLPPIAIDNEKLMAGDMDIHGCYTKDDFRQSIIRIEFQILKND